MAEVKGRHIAVVGGGVIGLSVANRLADRQAQVTLFSPQPLSEITSAVAAAYWAPHWIGDYDRETAISTLQVLQQLARDNVVGIRERRFEEWLTSEGAAELAQHLEEEYWWRSLAGIDFTWEEMSPRTFEFDGVGGTFVQKVCFTSIVARMPDYLSWLQGRCEQSGRVEIQRQWIDSLDELLPKFDFVVHCSGWGAIALEAKDPDTASMRILAGHVVIVEAPEIDRGVSLHQIPFHGRPVYVVPRDGSRPDVLCGGTAIDVTEQLSPRDSMKFRVDTECPEVIRRARAVLTNELANVRELEHSVGLRPMRSSVRVEKDSMRPSLIHCYGHGGSGLTLSWGSADRVVQILETL